MHGRACSCLLLLSFLVLPAGFLRSQSDRIDPTSGLARDWVRIPPRVWIPEPDPIRPMPWRPVAPPGTFGLNQFARAAGIIFSGKVTGIVHRPAAGGQAIETVAVTFHVEKAIRGAAPGEDLTITQWIGLWSSGERYRVGERAFFFFYPLSKVKLTSCIGGRMGRFAIDHDGWVRLSSQQLSAFRTDPVLGGKSRVRFSDFTLAVRQASGEESPQETRR